MILWEEKSKDFLGPEIFFELGNKIVDRWLEIFFKAGEDLVGGFNAGDRSSLGWLPNLEEEGEGR